MLLLSSDGSSARRDAYVSMMVGSVNPYRRCMLVDRFVCGIPWYVLCMFLATLCC
jgi:hypothetical protein